MSRANNSRAQRPLAQRWRYSLGVISVAVTLGGALLMRPVFEPPSFMLFYAPIALCAWYGGLSAGLFATLLSALASAYFLVPPTYSFTIGLDNFIRLDLFVLVAVFITILSAARQRSENEAQLQRERAAQLSEVATRLSSALAPHDIARLILDYGASAIGAAGGVVVLATPDGSELELIEARGYPPEFLADQRRLPMNMAAPLTDTARTHESSWIQSRQEALARYPQFADIHAQIDLHAWANLPLFLPDRVVGALELSFAAPRMFAPADRAFLTTLAQLCAQSLDRARIYAIEHQARLRAEQASERADLLAHMSQLLVSSLDYPATIQKVADLVVPRLADWCVVDILESDGTPTMTAAHRDPAQVRWAFELREIYPIDMSEPVGMPQVIRSGKAELYAEISDDLLQATAKTPEELAILRAVGYRSVMITPLRARGRVLGAVTFVTTETERRYRADDLAFAQDIADRAAVAIDNAMLYSGAQQARETAEAAVQLRDQFLSVAAHELKTPLTSLQLQVQLIQRRAAKAGSGDERDRRALKVMTDQMRRLDRMIGTLLDIARIEHGQLNIAGAPLDLDDLAQRVIAEIQPTTDIHPISYSCIGGPTVVMGDELRLEQVLQNLLQNAIKYSPNGGPIAVELRGDGSAVRLQVSDSGIGVPQAEIPQLFNQFYRAANADVKRISGLGIGLYVVREIIRMHGGAVEATSREGAGSAFSVTLPALAIGIEMETHPGE